MRILVVHTRHHERGGEDVVVDAECDLLRNCGHDVELVEFENPHGAPGAVALAQSPWNLGARRRITATIERFRPDIVHVHNTWFAASPSVIAAAAQSTAATVVTLHNYRLLCADATLQRNGATCNECVGHTPIPAIQHGCYRGSRIASTFAAATVVAARRPSTLQAVDCVIAPTRHLADVHVRAGVVAADRIAVKSHFISDPGPRPEPPSSSDTFVWAGRIAVGKGVDSLLAAWEQRTPDGRQLHVIGDGPLRQQLERNAPQDVTFLGARPLEETRARIRDARAFVFPSTWAEPFGMVLLEALAPGTPILGFDTADTAMITGGGAWLVSTGDVGALSGLFMATDDELNHIGAQARLRYLEAFTPQRNANELVAIYEQAIGRQA